MKRQRNDYGGTSRGEDVILNYQDNPSIPWILRNDAPRHNTENITKDLYVDWYNMYCTTVISSKSIEKWELEK